MTEPQEERWSPVELEGLWSQVKPRERGAKMEPTSRRAEVKLWDQTEAEPGDPDTKAELKTGDSMHCSITGLSHTGPA